MTNDAALGYMIMVARDLGYTQAEIDELSVEMQYQMDVCTEEAAEEVYRKS